jgi:hypothetical protein
MEISTCPSCGEAIEIDERMWLGQTLICPHCDEVLKVVELDPCELDLAFGEDWEDEDWEDEDWEDEDWEDEDWDDWDDEDEDN